MDLPLSANKDAALRSSRDSLDIENIGSKELTLAERFASQNQATLKKNERFSTSIETVPDKKEVKLEMKLTEKPKAEVKPQEIPAIPREIEITSTVAGKKAILEEVSHIDEDGSKDHLSIGSGSGVGGSSIPKEIHKSPIPARNTQKYVSQFADLKLTGGCLSQTDTTFSTNTQTTTTSGPSSMKILEQTPQLTSFKPQVKVKPQIFKKPFVRGPTTPEMARRGGNQE